MSVGDVGGECIRILWTGMRPNRGSEGKQNMRHLYPLIDN